MEIGSLGDILSPEAQMLILAAGMAFAFSLAITIIALPGLIRKMRQGGMVGRDVNKPGSVKVPELGGIAALFGFSISLSLVVGIQKLIGNLQEPPYLAVISVFFIAAMVGLIDDISNIPQRLKVIAVAFAALPLLLVHIGDSINLPFGYTIGLVGWVYFLYWLLLVPFGVSGVANAMNMSAGYNGLESGQIAIVSAAMLFVLLLRGGPEFSAIIPAFYEAGATAYYSLVKKVPDRRHACHNPVIHADGTLSPPKGAERYTLAYWILSRKPMTEPRLVRTILGLYATCGVAAIVLSVL